MVQRAISKTNFEAYRARTYRQGRGQQLGSADEAVDYVGERGFVYFWPIKGVDLPSLWAAVGGKVRAQEGNRQLATHVDVMIGNEEDFTASLGFAVSGADERLAVVEAESFSRMIDEAVADFPHFSVVATTLRTVRSATVNDWGAIGWSAATGILAATDRPGLEVLDRVGGGDSFASGLIFGLLSGFDLQKSLEYGAAHGALAMTTPGDTSMASLDEVERLVAGAGARVRR